MSRAARRALGIAAAALTAVVLASRLWFVFHRAFGSDEFEHAHATWAVSRGLVPYLDFFEHHTPWFYLAFAPFVRLFPTDRDPASAVALLVSWRLVMWVATAAVVALAYALGLQWRDRLTGVLAAACLVCSDEFLDTMLEIRPDVPALVCASAALWLTVRAHRSRETAAAGRWFLGAGLLFGAALMFTQKYAFAAPGVAAVLVAYAADGRGPGTRAGRARAAALFAAGAVVPLAVTMAWFAGHGALGPFLYFNGAANLEFNRSRFSSTAKLGAIGIRSPGLIGLGGAGLAWAVWRMARGESKPEARVLVFTAVSLLIGLFIMPVPFSQFFLMFFPHLAIFQASLLEDALPSRGGGWWFTRLPPAAAAIGILLALQVLTTGVLISQFASNAAQIETLDYVMAHTRPDETVLDGFSGYGAFRPHAWFYFFLGTPIMTDQDVDGLASGLRSGAIAPRLVVFDALVAGLPPAITAYLREHYAPVEAVAGSVWTRTAP